MSFELHPRLGAGSFELGRIAGCRLLLKNNALFPWLLLVPETEVEDLHELPEEQYFAVCGAIRKVSQFVSEHFKPEKLNVACIGNQVRQMHVHIVGRATSDPAWPGTVWAFEGKEVYPEDQVEVIRQATAKFLPLQ